MRYASVAIMTVTIVMTLLGAVILRVFDHEEYPTLGEAIWFTLQTVTTVGYGDNTPADFTGRLVAAAIMLTAIGLITVITAIITSTFVGAATKRNNEADDEQDRNRNHRPARSHYPGVGRPTRPHRVETPRPHAARRRLTAHPIRSREQVREQFAHLFTRWWTGGSA